MQLDLAIVGQYWPDIWHSFLLTLALSAATLLISTPLAFLLALARQEGPPWMRAMAAAYVNTFRTLPMLVVLYVAFYGLPVFGLPLAPVTAAMLGLTVAGTAYLAEDLRGGLLAVDRGQWLAARALGLPFWHTLRRIILPQAMRVLLPPYVSRAIIIVKSTSIAGIVAVTELTGETYALISQTYHSLEFLVVAGALYLLVNGVLSVVQEIAERAISRHLA